MKIVTFNLRHDADRWKERFPLIVEGLAAEKADIVAVQEVALPIKQAHQISAALEQIGLDYEVRVAPKWTYSRLPAFLEGMMGQREGIGILSRYPIQKYQRIALPEGRRVAQHVQVEIEDKRVNILNTHLHHKPLLDDVIRVQQMREVLNYIKQTGEQSWLLMGDFNALPESEVLKMTAKRFESPFALANLPEPDYTFPTPLVANQDFDFPNVRIDYLLCEREVFEVTDARIIFDKPHPKHATLYPSDHFGLVVSLTMTQHR